MKMTIKTVCVIGRGLNVSRTPPPCNKKNLTLNKPKRELVTKKSNNFKNYMVRQIPTRKIQPRNSTSEKTKMIPLFDANSKNELYEKIPQEKYNGEHFQLINQQGNVSEKIDNLMIDKSALSSQVIDNINYLVKKINLSFNEKKQESSFFISEGIFENAHFKLHCDNNNLDITMLNAHRQATDLLNDNQAYLAAQLATKEINLRRLVFG